MSLGMALTDRKGWSLGKPSPEKEKLGELLRKVLRLQPVSRAAQRRGRDGVGARGAAYAKVNAPRV